MQYLLTQLAGVTFNGRQANIKKCSEGDQLNLVREPDNQFDKYAIKALKDDLDLGYIPANIAREMAPLMDSGTQFHCVIAAITGGYGKYKYGVDIRIERESDTYDFYDDAYISETEYLLDINDIGEYIKAYKRDLFEML